MPEQAKRPASRQLEPTARQRQESHQASEYWEHARRPDHSREQLDAQLEPQGAPRPVVLASGRLRARRQQA